MSGHGMLIIKSTIIKSGFHCSYITDVNHLEVVHNVSMYEWRAHIDVQYSVTSPFGLAQILSLFILESKLECNLPPWLGKVVPWFEGVWLWSLFLRHLQIYNKSQVYSPTTTLNTQVTLSSDNVMGDLYVLDKGIGINLNLKC